MPNSPLNIAFKLATAGLALSLFLWITLASLGPYPAPAPSDSSQKAGPKADHSSKFDPFDPAYQVDVASPAELPKVQITGVDSPASATPKRAPSAILTTEVDPIVEPEIPTLDVPGATSSANEIPTLTVSDRSSAPDDGNEAPALPEIRPAEVRPAEISLPEPEIPELQLPTVAAPADLRPELVTESAPVAAPKPTIVIAPTPELTAELETLRDRQQSLQESLAQKTAEADAARVERGALEEQLTASRRNAEALQKSASELESTTADLRSRQARADEELAALKKQLEDAVAARKTAEQQAREERAQAEQRARQQVAQVREPAAVPALPLDELLPPLPEKSPTQLELESLYAVPPADSSVVARRDPFGGPMPPAPEPMADPTIDRIPATSAQWNHVFESDAVTCESCGSCGDCGNDRKRWSLFGEIESFFLRHKRAPQPKCDSCEPIGLLAKWNARRSSCLHCRSEERCREAAVIYGMPENATILPPANRPQP